MIDGLPPKGFDRTSTVVSRPSESDWFQCPAPEQGKSCRAAGPAGIDRSTPWRICVIDLKGRGPGQMTIIHSSSHWAYLIEALKLLGAQSSQGLRLDSAHEEALRA